MADGSQQTFPFGLQTGTSRLRPDEIVVDLFAGGGGASEALEEGTGRAIDEAINHNELALAMHAVNHPFTRHHATVWIHGHPYVIVDIRLRMLTPRELFTAQGFPRDYIIDRTADGRSLSISKQVALVGNSVSPPPMFALVDCNLPAAAESHRRAA